MFYQQDHHTSTAAATVKTTTASEPTAPKDKEAPAFETSTTKMPPSKVEKPKPGTEMGSAGEFNYGYESVSSHPFRSMFFVLLLIGVPISLFLWCGGLRCFRRVIGGKGVDRTRYKRVGDQDLEK